ncbi:YHYH protein [Pseudorhodobacter sp. W20_MBD10_FR17]|uniref:YHYH protein n=1 Tax=Pseudorhodobacter sp. W20_MBD10_FR17 TaxID=3240266 RepID=UPI003F9584C1
MTHFTRSLCRLLLTGVVCAPVLAPALANAHTDLKTFNQSAFDGHPAVVHCTLEDGTASDCYEFTVDYMPEGLKIGPFCPATLDDKGGIWNWTGENGKLYRIDADFLHMLDGLGYRFFDDDGTVHTVDNATQRPTVDHACINVTADESVKITMRLPIEPVMATMPTQLGTVGKVGVALDGVPIFSDAPSIQQTGHMPALDTCGGHIDPGGWYHWHATATDIDTVYATEDVDASCALTQDSGAQFGYAFDGFAMFGSTEADGTAPVALDACNGHIGETALGRTYHYHASTAFPNLPPCLVGIQAQDNFSTTAKAGVGAARSGQGAGQGQLPPGFDEAATKLGITTEELMQALGGAQGGPPDIAAAAAKLGKTEAELKALLPAPPGQ